MRLGDFIRYSSKEAAIDGVRDIKLRYLPNEKLITKSNPLEKNALKSVKKHFDVRNSYSISDRDVNTYLAASSLAHLLDGWTYLAEAFNALLNGNEGSCVHLAYYAELRSAMSILASEGVGAFNDKHLGAFSKNSTKEYPANFFKPTGGYEQPKCPTHKFVWEAVEKWSTSMVKANPELLKAFKVRGRNFHELLEFFHPLTSTSSLLGVKTVKEWLKAWCLDIKLYKDDRETRNIVSYRPQRIKNFGQTINFQNIINDLDKYWSVISPSPTDNFDMLDRYLLRMLFDGLYEKIVPVATRTPTLKKELITNAFNQFGINDELLFSFLNSEAPYAGNHIIFEKANIKETTPLSILARATLLLRISVGLVSQLYKAGGISKNDLNFVWSNYAIDNGFWSADNPIVNFEDLWFNIQPSISDLREDINSPGTNNNLHAIKERNPDGIIHFGQINRACLWGMDF